MLSPSLGRAAVRRSAVGLGVLLQQLQPLLQDLEVHRRTGVQGHAIVDVAGAQSPVPGDLDVTELALNNAYGDHPTGRHLVGNECPGGEVPLVDVIVGQSQAQGLEVFGCQLSVGVGSRNAKSIPAWRSLYSL